MSGRFCLIMVVSGHGGGHFWAFVSESGRFLPRGFVIFGRFCLVLVVSGHERWCFWAFLYFIVLWSFSRQGEFSLWAFFVEFRSLLATGVGVIGLVCLILVVSGHGRWHFWAFFLYSACFWVRPEAPLGVCVGLVRFETRDVVFPAFLSDAGRFWPHAVAFMGVSVGFWSVLATGGCVSGRCVGF